MNFQAINKAFQIFRIFFFWMDENRAEEFITNCWIKFLKMTFLVVWNVSVDHGVASSFPTRSFFL